MCDAIAQVILGALVATDVRRKAEEMPVATQDSISPDHWLFKSSFLPYVWLAQCVWLAQSPSCAGGPLN